MEICWGYYARCSFCPYPLEPYLWTAGCGEHNVMLLFLMLYWCKISIFRRHLRNFMQNFIFYKSILSGHRSYNAIPFSAQLRVFKYEWACFGGMEWEASYSSPKCLDTALYSPQEMAAGFLFFFAGTNNGVDVSKPDYGFIFCFELKYMRFHLFFSF